MKPRFSAALGMLGILALATGCQSSPEPSGANASVQTDATASAQPAGTDGQNTAQVKTAGAAQYSGFLAPEIYQRLQPSPNVEGVRSYVDRSRDYRAFRKIMFDPTEVYLVPNPEYKGLPKEALARMTGDFQNAFKAALAPDYMIVTQPGPDVLRIRSAITGVQPAPPQRGAMDYIPIKALFNVARKAAGNEPQVVEMSAEFEVLAPDGALVAAVTATRKGDDHLPQGAQINWEQMQAISDFWARNFKERLDELRLASAQPQQQK